MRIWLVALAGLFVVGWSTHSAAAPEFIGIDSVYGRLSGVSGDGTLAVGTGEGVFGDPLGGGGFRWTRTGGVEPVGDLPGGATVSSALSASADGSVVVGLSNSASGEEAFRWTSGGGIAGLGDLAGGIFRSNANEVSADGSVVVGFGTVSSGSQAFRWTAGTGMVGLGDLPGGSATSVANGVSADGSVVVGRSGSAAGTEAFRWTSTGGMLGLGDLPGGTFFSTANDVAADGSTVVGQGSAADNFSAFRWTQAGGMEDIGIEWSILNGALASSVAHGVSGNGSVVVGGLLYDLEAAGAFVWDPVNGLRNLQDVLEDDYGLDLSGWFLAEALAISDDGTTIVGWGFGPAGGAQPWIAVIPEPATAWLVTAGLVALARARRSPRRR